MFTNNTNKNEKAGSSAKNRLTFFEIILLIELENLYFSKISWATFGL